MKPTGNLHRLALAGALLHGTVDVLADQHDPEQWYRTDYAPLWSDRPAERLDEMLDHYAPTVRSYADGGEVTDSPTAAWLGDSLDAWVEEGWLRAELTGLLVDRINDGTAAFKARWEDHYADGSAETSCGWYLAARAGDTWRFTAYADLDCGAHGL